MESRASASAAAPPRVRPTDVALVTAVPVVLVAVFLLPRGVRLDLALLYTRPTLLSAYASHFVHLELSHLLANLLVFLAVGPFSLLVSVRSGRRRRFSLVALTILLAFPFAFSGLNVLFPRPRLGFGFSGLGMAFVGYLPHALADHSAADASGETRAETTLLTLAFFLGTAIIALRVAPSIQAVSMGGDAIVAAGVGSALAVLGCLRPAGSAPPSRGTALSETLSPTVAFGGLLFVLLLLIGFPRVSAADGRVVNIFVHLLGYSFGYIVPYVAFRVLDLDSTPRSRRTESDS